MASLADGGVAPRASSEASPAITGREATVLVRHCAHSQKRRHTARLRDLSVRLRVGGAPAASHISEWDAAVLRLEARPAVLGAGAGIPWLLVRRRRDLRAGSWADWMCVAAVLALLRWPFAPRATSDRGCC